MWARTTIATALIRVGSVVKAVHTGKSSPRAGPGQGRATIFDRPTICGPGQVQERFTQNPFRLRSGPGLD